MRKKTQKKLLWIFLVFSAMSLGFTLVYKIHFSRPYLTVVGVVRMADGLGRQSVEIIEALKNEVSVGFLQTSRPCYKDVPKNVKRILKNQYRPLGKVVIFEECIWTPEKEHYKLLRAPRSDDQIRFAYTMFESTRIPEQWVSILNEYFDAAIVPDPYLVHIYEKCGVEIPVFVLPLGLNLKPFLDQEVKKKPHHPIVFGNFAACLGRKNQRLLVEAFHEAFGESSQVSLKINSRYCHPEVAKEIDDYLQKHQIKNVTFSKKCFTNEEYLQEFKSLDCLVSISKGEGFSIQPREAMALGIPVIVTDNTAQKTLCKSGLVKAVKAEMIEPSMNTWGSILKYPLQYGYDFNCRKEDVVQALQEMYQNYDVYLARAEKLKEWVKKYDYSEIRPFYISLVKPKLVELSTKNKITEEGISTDSKALYDKYQKLMKKGL